MVIIFSNEKARTHLLEKEFVYTFRKNRRKQFIKMPEMRQRVGTGLFDWATDKRLGKKITDITIHEYGPYYHIPGPYTLDQLEPYHLWSGFDSLEEWKEAILAYSPGLEKGWLYKVSTFSQQVRTEKST